MTEPLLFDPELEGLLREVAADPRSKLLKLPRPSRPSDLLARPDPVTRSRAGLTVAERHLIEVHRDELAHLLRRACLMKFFDDPERSIYLNRSASTTVSIHHDSPAEFASRAEFALAYERNRGFVLEALELVEACVNEGQRERPTITQLARASQVLQVTAQAESYVGLDQTLRGQHDTAARILGALLAGPVEQLVRSCSLETFGLAASSAGRMADACEYYRQASLGQGYRPSAYIGWLLLAIQAGNKLAAIEASRVLDSEPAQSQSVATDLATKYKAQMRRGALVITPQARQVVLELQDKLGVVSKEVACVVLE